MARAHSQNILETTNNIGFESPLEAAIYFEIPTRMVLKSLYKKQARHNLRFVYV